MVSDDPHAAAATAVTPIWTALSHVSFSAETDATRSAITSLGVELGGIYEGGHGPILRVGPKSALVLGEQRRDRGFENLLVVIDVGDRGRWAHERHVVERRQ